jgi:hypothetical protein
MITNWFIDRRGLLHFEDINVNDIFFSIGNDGSILAVAPTEVLDQYR